MDDALLRAWHLLEQPIERALPLEAILTSRQPHPQTDTPLRSQPIQFLLFAKAPRQMVCLAIKDKVAIPLPPGGLGE